jgi:hypothetical protein
MLSRAAGGAEEVWVGRSVAAASGLMTGEQAEMRVARLTNQARRRSLAPIMIKPFYRDPAGMRRAGDATKAPHGLFSFVAGRLRHSRPTGDAS